jgi:hypothetical protein
VTPSADPSTQNPWPNLSCGIFAVRPIILCLSALLVSTLCAHAQAQKLYQCGKTFSQTPCAADAIEKRMYGGPPSEPTTPKPRGFELCAAAAVKATGSLEPESARVQMRGKRRMEVIQYAGEPLPAQRYDLYVSARNDQGMYALNKALSCWLSEDQSRILQFAESEGREASMTSSR